MYLSRLLYYSVNAVQSQEGSLQQELKSILLASQRNNPPLGVSGALIFNYSYFAQVLEGDRKAITSIFCQVAKDPRHKDIVLLEVEPISERLFSNWNMSFVGGAVTENELRRYGTSAQFHPEKMTAQSLLLFVREVIDASNSNSRAKAS
jgi:hypothetical protein